MRTFSIPDHYRAPEITAIKKRRGELDPKKKDLSPSLVQRAGVDFYLARHFGFCYGVENAIETAYRAIEENAGRQVFLISEMIHNPGVNSALAALGVKFLRDSSGNELFPLSGLKDGDIIIIPAFGAATEVLEELGLLGLKLKFYDATCPFVQRVWKRATELGQEGFSLIIHGKREHEEVRATFSRAALAAPALVIKNMQEAATLARFILNDNESNFFEIFKGRFSVGFDPQKHLKRIGVVNQTTMLASETGEIMEFLRQTFMKRYGADVTQHFANTRDTLCYATLDNQEAVIALAQVPAELAIVVGGYNSSNTTHLAEILSERLPTFFVKDEDELLSVNQVRHLHLDSNSLVITDGWLPWQRPLRILLTSGASCPDSALVNIMNRVEALLR